MSNTHPPTFYELASEAERDELKKVNSKKRFSYFILLCCLPYYFLRAVFIRLVLLVSPSTGHRLASQFLRSFFKKYFFIKGVLPYDPAHHPVPTQLQKPIVIVGNRYHFLSALFAYTLCPFPIVIPQHDSISLFSIPWFRPIRIIGRFFRCISYCDAPLSMNMDNVRTLLKHGYPVYVHANHGISDYRSNTTIYLHHALMDILNLEVDVYFMRLNGFENYRFSSFRNPILVTINYESMQSVLAPLTPADQKGCGQKIAEFFGYLHYRWV